MVRAKKGSKRGRQKRGVLIKDERGYYTIDPVTGLYKAEEVAGDWICGCYRGTKKVNESNAKRHPRTGLPQRSEVLVQMGMEVPSLPPSEAEFFWQRGVLRTGNRFVPGSEKDQAAS
jgi:hypothetical protein